MKKYLVLLLLMSVALSACQTAIDAEQKPIGGDKDSYGCLTAAGYSWNGTIGACIRPWELDESQARAAKIAIAPISYSPVTVEKVEPLRCPGCFKVTIRTAGEPVVIELARWEIVNNNPEDSTEITSFDECVAAGNPVMESYPRQCAADGKTFTEEHVCTEEESANAMCTKEYMPVCGKIVLNTGETKYQTFGNKCEACAAMKAVSYVPGECPEKL